MKIPSVIISFIIITLFFFSNHINLAQDFEGRIKSREISISINLLGESLYGEMSDEDEQYEETNEEEYEEDSFTNYGFPKELIDKIMSMKVDELRAIGKKAPNSEFVDEYQKPYEENETEILIKGSKWRVDAEDDEGKVTVIYDISNPVMKIIRWDQKSVVSFNIEQFKKQMEAAMGQYSAEGSESPTGEDAFSLTPAGEKSVINGFECELYKGVDEYGSPQQLWLSTSADDRLLGTFKKMQEIVTSMTPKSESDKEIQFYLDKKGIPIVDKKVTGESISVDEIIEIERMNISDDKFLVPTGFTEMDMKDLMQQGFE